MIALIVEDERDQRDLVCEALEAVGWTVELAEDGIAALGRMRRVVPDVILLDLRMPNLDGIELLVRLRSEGAWPSLVVILTTGVEVGLTVRALADGVLMKPFTAEALIRTLDSCMSQRNEQPLWEG
ncbi:MAG TPA: response regulator [Anaeromyxobacteraceae bacterium]